MFGEILYNRIPEIYRIYDENALKPYQLRNFLYILGAGLDDMYATIQLSEDYFNPDTADVSVLDLCIKQLGFKYPYMLTTEEKRSILKTLPVLYEYKGTAKVFEYLARSFFGKDVVADAIIDSDFSMLVDPNFKLVDSFYVVGVSGGNVLINVITTFSKAVDDFESKNSKFKAFADLFRPINRMLKYTVINNY